MQGDSQNRQNTSHFKKPSLSPLNNAVSEKPHGSLCARWSTSFPSHLCRKHSTECTYAEKRENRRCARAFFTCSFLYWALCPFLCYSIECDVPEKDSLDSFYLPRAAKALHDCDSNEFWREENRNEHERFLIVFILLAKVSGKLGWRCPRFNTKNGLVLPLHFKCSFWKR